MIPRNLHGWLSAGMLLLLTLATHAWAADAGGKLVRIGLLSYRPVAQSAQAWQPTAQYLDTAIPDHRFEFVPLHNKELELAVARHEIDFILTQPEQYAVLRSRHGLAAIATLMPLIDGSPTTQFGGVIFTRSDRQDIQSLVDIRGKQISAVYEQSLGGYRMQQWELLKAGIRLPGDARSLTFTGQPQDRVVTEVLAGRAEVGFVRTGVLEAMQREGKLAPYALRIVAPVKGSDYPLPHSTALYPEWPLAALHHTPEPITKAVALALLNIRPDSPAAKSGDYYGFSPPGDYAPVEAILLRLRANPDRLNQFDVLDIAEKYQIELAVLLALLFFIAVGIALRLNWDNQRIKAASREREMLLGSLAEGVCGIDSNGRCIFVNAAALSLLGYEKQELEQQHHSLFDFFEFAPIGGQPGHAMLDAILEDGERRDGETVALSKNGSHLPVRYTITPLRDGNHVRGIVLTFQDITERKKAEQALQVAAVAFETQEGMIITDTSGRILRVNHAFTEITGYCAEEVAGHTPAMFKSGRHDNNFYETMWHTLLTEGGWQGEIWNRRKNGEIYPVWLNITAVPDKDGRVRHYVGSFLDISQRKQAEEQIEYMALYDPLTNLPNRRLLSERLGRALVSGGRASTYGALLFIDLDNFKTLNDSLGHDVGDKLLVQVAERLTACVGPGETVARQGGDEFVVILENLGDRAEEAAASAELVGEQILAQISQPYDLNGIEHHGSASLGLTLFQDQHLGVDELLKRADMALYQAKSAGRNTLRFFDPAMQAAVEARAALENDLRRGIKQREFILYYQDQVDHDGLVIGAEALVRWQHPKRGVVAPNDFIPLAESTNLIVNLGQQILESACAQLAVWQANAATAQLSLSVNISANQFRQPDFVDRLRGTLNRFGITGQGLKLELTESLMLEGLADVIEKMHTLKALGLTLSLDDFGTGYSSLAYLRQLPLDQIKIDQSFVRNALDDENDATITRTILALGQTFGLEVIAEGVETEAQRQFLIENGCRVFQGYLFGRPRPLSDTSQSPLMSEAGIKNAA